MGYLGCVGCFCVSDTAEVELKVKECKPLPPPPPPTRYHTSPPPPQATPCTHGTCSRRAAAAGSPCAAAVH
jgi:hypothetical protein